MKHVYTVSVFTHQEGISEHPRVFTSHMRALLAFLLKTPGANEDVNLHKVKLNSKEDPKLIHTKTN